MLEVFSTDKSTFDQLMEQVRYIKKKLNSNIISDCIIEGLTATDCITKINEKQAQLKCIVGSVQHLNCQN